MQPETAVHPGLLGGHRQSRPAPVIDRLPPHSQEAEQGVLGCLLLSPVDCLGECQQRIRSGDEFFYDLRHQVIYDGMVELAATGQALDTITLQQRLKDKQLLDQVGGIAYLMELSNKVPSAANLTYYLDIVAEKAMLRKIIITCTSVVGEVYDCDDQADEILAKVEKSILAIRPQAVSAHGAKELVLNALTRLEQTYEHPDRLNGLSTGLTDLDRLTDGLHPGELVVIAAFPSCGKTALAGQIIRRHALVGTPSAILTAEMTPDQLMLRCVCGESRTNHRRVFQADLPKINAAAGKLANAPLFIEPVHGFTISQVQATGRRLKQKHDIKLMALDYLQLIEGTGDNREQQVASVSRGMKQLALELGIPIIVLSQLNDDGKLRESRAIGQDGDSIWKLANDGEKQPTIQPVKLAVDKCRDGETGMVRLTFLKEFTRFENAARLEE